MSIELKISPTYRTLLCANTLHPVWFTTDWIPWGSRAGMAVQLVVPPPGFGPVDKYYCLYLNSDNYAHLCPGNTTSHRSDIDMDIMTWRLQNILLKWRIRPPYLHISIWYTFLICIFLHSCKYFFIIWILGASWMIITCSIVCPVTVCVYQSGSDDN